MLHLTKSKGKVAVLHDCDRLTGALSTDDCKISRADHEVLMYERMIYTVLTQFILRHIFAVLYAGWICLSEGEVTGCILVEQRVVEENAALRDRRIMRDESHLAQIEGTFVCLQKLLQMFTPLFRIVAHDLPVAERKAESVNQIPVVVQRF